MVIRSALAAVTAVFLASCILLPGSTADGSEGPISLGIKGGINLASLESDAVPQSDNFLRFGGGLSLITSVQPGVGLDLDLLYLMKGSKHGYTSAIGETLEIEARLDYVVVNPVLRLAPGRNGAGLYMLVGPELGFLVKAESVSTWNGTSSKTDLEEDFKDFDWSVNAGIGFQTAQNSRTSFFIEGRYSHGLTNIQDEDVVNTYGETKTRGIYLMSGLRF